MARFGKFLSFAIIAALCLDYMSDKGFPRLLHVLAVASFITSLQLLGWVIWKWILYPKFLSPLRRIPGPKGGSFLMGHFQQNRVAHPGKLLRSWIEDVPNEGIIRYLDIFNSERIVPVSPAALADVLVHRSYDFEKPAPLRKTISQIIGMGLFLAEGEEHKRQRKAIMPAFAFRHVRDLYPSFWAKSTELIEAVELQTKPLQQNEATWQIEANGWASRATLDIIGMAGMGQDFESLDDKPHALNETYRKIFKISRAGAALAILGTLLPPWVVRNLPFKRNDTIKAASDTIRRTCFQLINAKKLNMEKGVSSKDILSVALSSGTFSDEELVNQMMTFLAAGHETSASALTWAIYLLCKHPDVQQRLRAEVLEHLGDSLNGTVPVRAENIDALPYLNAVCSETLRLFPPVSATVREAIVNTFILDVPIPKGTAIVLAPWAVNTSSALWGDDSHTFDPERWIRHAAGGGADSNFSFLTFLHGPRSCIGQAFARAEFACLLAAWVGNFKTELADKEKEVVVRGGITVKPKDGLFVNVSTVLQ